MSDFKAKMHQIRFRLGLCPRPRWGSLQRSPRPLAGLEPTSKGREGRGITGGEEGEGRDQEKEKDREGERGERAREGGRRGKGKGKGGEERGVQCVPYFSRCLLATLVCVRHTFCQLAYRSDGSDPSTDFYS